MTAARKPGLELKLPARRKLRLTHLLLDFNGTLALDGALLPGIAQRLRRLAAAFEVEILTADTFGSAAAIATELPVRLRVVDSGADKARRVHAIGGQRVVAIGNGANDAAMFAAAALAIAVIGPEGSAVAALRKAQLATADIRTALDLLANPQRLVASLRR